ncbi:MAG TPA: hypothetical protein VG944_13980 [Fimbriimonas sp.]|nr:hypothetical protein [Fimbriimonas sp.]
MACLWIVGCGGGGGGGKGSSLAMASGQVTLPPGFPGKASSLFVVAAGDKQPVSASGAFHLNLMGPGETLVTLQDAQGNLVMMGYADTAATGSPEAGGHGQISATTTAEALLFYGIGGFTTPSEEWPNVRSAITATSECARLAGVVSGRVAAVPTALANNDAQIGTEISTDSASIASSHMGSGLAKLAGLQKSSNSVAKVEVVRHAKPGASTAGNLVLVQPSGEQSGIEVLNNPNGDGIVFVNHLRRRCAAYIYETAHQASGGKLEKVTPAPHNFTQPSLVSKIANAMHLPLLSNQILDIAPSEGTTGLTSLVLDAVFSSDPFTPSQSAPVILGQDGASVRTDYTVIVLGPSFSTLGDLTQFPPYNDPSFLGFRNDWRNAVSSLNWQVAIQDIVVPAISCITLIKPTIQPINPDLVVSVADTVSRSSDSLTSMVVSGNVLQMAKTLFSTVGNNPQLRQAILAAIWTQTFGAGSFEEQFNLAQSELKKFFFVQNVVDAMLKTIDVSAVTVDNSIHHAGETWTVSIVQKNVRLAPATATVDNQTQLVSLVATPSDQGDASVPYLYHYHVAGNAGGGVEDFSHVSPVTDLDSTDSAVSYLEGSTAANGQSDTVTVQVYLNAGTGAKPQKGQLLGEAQSVITVSISGDCGTFPKGVTSACGTISIDRSQVASNGTITATVKYRGGGACSVGGAVGLDNVVVASATLDGSPAKVIDNFAVGFPEQEIGDFTHVVVFKLAPNNPDQCPSPALGGDPITYPGPWAVMNPGSSLWSIGQPFEVKN